MLIDTLKQYLAELEQTQVGGRNVSRLVLDVRSGKVELEFADDKNADDGSRLERYERHDANKIQGWKNDFVLWERKHRGRIGEQDYRERVVKEVVQLLASGFLVPDVDLLNANKLKRNGKSIVSIQRSLPYCATWFLSLMAISALMNWMPSRITLRRITTI